MKGAQQETHCCCNKVRYGWCDIRYAEFRVDRFHSWLFGTWVSGGAVSSINKERSTLHAKF